MTSCFKVMSNNDQASDAISEPKKYYRSYRQHSVRLSKIRAAASSPVIKSMPFDGEYKKSPTGKNYILIIQPSS